MTAVADVKTILEALTGHTMLGPALSNIGLNFAITDPYVMRLSSPFVDPENPTNEEAAQLLKDSVEKFLRDNVFEGGTRGARPAADIAIAAGGTAALTNFDEE
jgi:hypothetical protein